MHEPSVLRRSCLTGPQDCSSTTATEKTWLRLTLYFKCKRWAARSKRQWDNEMLVSPLGPFSGDHNWTGRVANFLATAHHQQWYEHLAMSYIVREHAKELHWTGTVSLLHQGWWAHIPKCCRLSSLPSRFVEESATAKEPCHPSPSTVEPVKLSFSSQGWHEYTSKASTALTWQKRCVYCEEIGCCPRSLWWEIDGLIWIDMDWYGLIWIDMDWYGLIWIDMDWYGLIWIDGNVWRPLPCSKVHIPSCAWSF